MAGLTPYGDPFERVQKLLGALEADAAQIEAETKAVSQTTADIEKARTNLERQVGRGGSQIGKGRAISEEEAVAGQTRQTKAVDDTVAAEKRLSSVRQQSLQAVQRLNQFGPYAYTRSLKDQEQSLSRIVRLQALNDALIQSQGKVPLGGAAGGALPPGGGGRTPYFPPYMQAHFDRIRGATSAAEIGKPQTPVPTPALFQQAKEQAQGNGEIEQSAKRVTAATLDQSKATGNLIQRYGLAARDTRSYGALTTEFFDEAKRGTVTIRDLGFQVQSTIGKFGGWLGAGAALYTALGAVTAIGKGSIDSASGVNQLARVVNNVNPDQTTAKFRSLARAFNLPISDVADAGYQMGKVFHDQNQALEASRSVLYAVKVGELDVASASRYLTAITQGFNLTASDQQVVFDQVNQAQNRYNISISSLLAGTAKAAGSFKLAGGDATHLIALITTLSKATGQTGDVIGTAIQRSPHFVNLAQNQATLQSFGIDPKQKITDIYDQAIKAAQTEGKDKQRRLAEAIFGPQYGARVGTALLQQQQLFNKVLGDVSPEKAKGSAQRELNTTLGALSERLKAIVTELEIFGSELASAGVLTPFAGMLSALHGVLFLTNNILEVFNSLPKPVRTVVSLLLEAGAAVKALRFFNVGQSFAEGSAGAKLFTSPQQDKKLYQAALGKESNFLAKEQESTSRRLAAMGLTRDKYAKIYATAQAEEAAIVSSTADDAEARNAAAARTDAAATRLNTVQSQILEQEVQQEITLQRQVANQEQQVLLRKASNDQAKALAAESGVVIPNRLGGPPDPAAQAELKRRQEAGLIGGAGGATTVIPGGAAVTSQAGTAEIEREAARVKAAGVGFRGKLGALASAGGAFGLFGGVVKEGSGKLTTVAQSTGAKIDAAYTSIGGAKGAASLLGKGLRGLASGLYSFLGPIGIAITGFIILQEALSSANDKLNAMDEAASKAQGAQPRSVKAIQAQVASLNKSAQESSDTGFSINPVTDIQHVTAYYSGAAEAKANALSAQAANIDAEQSRIIRALDRGRKVVSDYLTGDRVKEFLNKDIQSWKKGKLADGEFRGAVNNLVASVKASLPSDEANKLVEAIRSQVIDMKNLGSKYNDIASALAPEVTAAKKNAAGVSGTIDSLSQTISSGVGGNKGDIKRLTDLVLVSASEFLKSADPAVRALASARIQSLTDALQGAAQQNLDQDLAFAKGQKERDAAYKKYIDSLDPKTINSEYKNQRNQVEGELRNVRQHIASINNQIANAKQETGGVELRRTDAGHPSAALKKELDSRSKQAKALRDELNSLHKAQSEAAKRLRLIRKQEQEQKFQEDTQTYEARTALLASEANAGLPQIQVQLQRIGVEIRRSIQHYGRNSQQVLQLLAQQQDLQGQVVQDQLSLLQANADVRAAGINQTTNPVGFAKAGLQKLQETLAFQKAHRGQFSAADIKQTEAQLIQGQTELEQTIKDQADQLRDAAFDIREARANFKGNDVRAAKIEIEKALSDLAHSDTPLERRQARTAIINARASKEQAIFQSRLDTLSFEHDIDKLTTDQYIRQLQNLLHLANITKEQRRQIREQIFQLRHEADQSLTDLDVGSIKLPTIYEIRRAIQGGINKQTNVTVNNKVTVNAKGASADAVVGKLSQALNGGNQSALRASGLM